MSTSPIHAHSHGHGEIPKQDFTFRSLLRTMTNKGKLNEEDKDKSEVKKAEDSKEEEKAKAAHKLPCSIMKSMKKYMDVRENDLDVVDEIKNDDETIGIEEEASY